MSTNRSPYDYAASERLVALAEERGVPLAVGFNRRYAPAYRQCLDPARPDRPPEEPGRPPRAPARFVFDDFIHVIDTLRFLAPGTVDHVGIRSGEGGLLHHAVLQLGGDGFTALGVMNRLSGSTRRSWRSRARTPSARSSTSPTSSTTRASPASAAGATGSRSRASAASSRPPSPSSTRSAPGSAWMRGTRWRPTNCANAWCARPRPRRGSPTAGLPVPRPLTRRTATTPPATASHATAA